MQLRIIPEQGYLIVEVTGRESAEDMRQAIAAVLTEVRRHKLFRVLAVVKASQALFKVEESGLAAILHEIGDEGPWKIALVGDTPELRAAHGYLAILARQRRIEVRPWAHVTEAVRWLKSAPDAQQRYRFTRADLSRAPDGPGVYTLWQGDELIYIGRANGGAKTIRSCLLDHYFGSVDPVTERATHYSWELTDDPAAREAELLREYQETWGNLPRGNQKKS